METKTWAIGLAALCALMGSAGQWLFKRGSASVDAHLMSWLTNGNVIGGMALYGLSAVLFIFALKHGRLSILYPVIATSYIWVTLISAQALGEAVSVSKWGGIALILGGVILIAGDA